jgi:excisionase family DNA binding protein
MSSGVPEYTIQEASAKLGVPVQKLRRWDAQGVLVAGRTDGGHRRYSREIIDGLARSPLGPIDKVEDQLATARKSLRESAASSSCCWRARTATATWSRPRTT